MARASSPPSLPAPGRPRFQRLRVLFALVVREMGVKFGRSSGGYFWAIAQPLGGIVLLSIAFSLALRTPPIGTSFLLFYATGIIPFTMYQAMAGGVAGAIGSNKGLLNYPVVSVLDAIFAKFVLNFMTVTLVGLLLFWGIITFQGLHVTLDPAMLVLGTVMASAIGLGVGALNCVLFGFFPTWKNVWAVLTRPLFIVSGIFFTFESAPEGVPGGAVVQPDHPCDRGDAVGHLRGLRSAIRLPALCLRPVGGPFRGRRLAGAAPCGLSDRPVSDP